MAAYTNTVMLADTSDVAGYMGENIDVSFTETMQDLQGVYAEAYLCNLLKYDAVTNWATINAVYKLMMSEYVARSIAMTGIMYNVSGFSGTLQEATTMVNLHLIRMQQIIEVLQSEGVQDFMGVNT